MLSRIFRPRFQAATIDTLYGAIVAQARLPEFYEEFGVADTAEGRLELILLHLAVVMRRLERETGGRAAQSNETKGGVAGRGAALGRALLDAFGRDIDHNLREMGVGDLTVPKQMKRVFEAFYGRARSYQGALAQADPAALEAALARNVFDGASATEPPREPDIETPRSEAQAVTPAHVHSGAVRLARYVRGAVAHLDRTDDAQIHAGRLAFPAPRAILADDENRTDRQD